MTNWLFTSRKTLVGLLTILVSTFIAALGLWLKADKDFVLTLIKVVGGVGFTTVGGVALEDAAEKVQLPPRSGEGQ